MEGGFKGIIELERTRQKPGMPMVALIRMTEETIKALVKGAPCDKVELRNPPATITFGETPRLRVGGSDCSLVIHAEREEETECYVCEDADDAFVQIGPVKQKIFVQQDFDKASSHIVDRTQEIDMLKDKRKARVLADNNKAAKEKVKEKQYVVETVLKKDKADRGSVLETFDQELRNKQLRKSNSDPVPNNGNHKSSSDASKVNNAVEDTQPAGAIPDGTKSTTNKASKPSKRPKKGKQPSEEQVRELLLESLKIRPCSVATLEKHLDTKLAKDLTIPSKATLSRYLEKIAKFKAPGHYHIDEEWKAPEKAPVKSAPENSSDDLPTARKEPMDDAKKEKTTPVKQRKPSSSKKKAEKKSVEAEPTPSPDMKTQRRPALKRSRLSVAEDTAERYQAKQYKSTKDIVESIDQTRKQSRQQESAAKKSSSQGDPDTVGGMLGEMDIDLSCGEENSKAWNWSGDDEFYSRFLTGVPKVSSACESFQVNELESLYNESYAVYRRIHEELLKNSTKFQELGKKLKAAEKRKHESSNAARKYEIMANQVRSLYNERAGRVGTMRKAFDNAKEYLEKLKNLVQKCKNRSADPSRLT